MGGRAVQNSGLSKTAEFMNDFWELHKKYSGEINWAALLDEIDSLAKKYNSGYFTQLLFTFLDNLEYQNGNVHPQDRLLYLHNRLRKERGLDPVGILRG